METIGEYIRRVREEKGIPLSHIVKVTKIRETYLKAIEENNKSSLPGEAYYMAFLRSYTNCLGIDFEELKKQFLSEDIAAKKNAFKIETAKSPENKEVLKAKNNKSFFNVFLGNKVLRNGLIGVIIIIILYMFAFHRSDKNQNEPEKKIREEIKKEEKDTTKISSLQVDTTTSVFKPVPAPASKKENIFTLTAIGLETTWIRVRVDDKDTYELFVKPGEKRIWNANDKFELKVGDAGGIKVKINDKDVPPLGKRGEVINSIVFPRDKKK
ncbi:DUF4115 domain-containing protein [Candidatus Poribacteria bacterium]|nr:DUF4115 domain-containing protein [Candidatus Poribacteria bacterium]